MLMRIIPSLELMEAESYRKQQTSFCVLTLFVIAILLLLHTLFASLLGEPSTWVIALLGFSFSVKIVELVWLQGQTNGITERTARLETALSIAGIFLLSALLALLTNRDDAPYFVLLAIPILQCAYHFGLVPTALTISAAVGMIFFWMHYFFLMHPPPLATEYLEAGMISIIYILMGLLVWFLVHQLKLQQTRLSENMVELESTRERLIREEKLAAVGRLASGIAHEIRNPVAMISSSLTTATSPGIGEVDREEMLQIAAKESSRLEHLTKEFLSYARPSAPQRSHVLVSDLLIYTADVVKAHATKRSIEVVCLPVEDLAIEIDSAQVQGALLNLVLNGIDAMSTPGTVELSAKRSGSFVRIDVQNSGYAIPDSVLPRIFEPFYSTKPKGAGLGLAIARRVAEDHGGDLWVSCNENGRVVFSITLAAAAKDEKVKGM
jgi:signal transduction histidine kinase